MTPTDVLAQSAMPPANPSYPYGPYRFVGREYMIITCESDPEAIRAMVPEPLVPDGSNHVHYEWIECNVTRLCLDTAVFLNHISEPRHANLA